MVAGRAADPFSSRRDDRVHRTFDLFVMDADGSGQRNLTHTPRVSEHAASWGPARGAARQVLLNGRTRLKKERW